MFFSHHVPFWTYPAILQQYTSTAFLYDWEFLNFEGQKRKLRSNILQAVGILSIFDCVTEDTVLSLQHQVNYLPDSCCGTEYSNQIETI